MSRDVSLKDLLRELAEERGFDMRGYKATTLERRFRKRIFQLNLGSFADYAEYIRKNPDETNELLNTVLINVTEFFRDPPAWEILRTEILPPILRKLKPGESFRAWSAGCATGQEAYSLAIVLSELLGPRILQFDVKVYATDIDEDALTTARRAEYPAEALRRMRPKWRDKYFHGKGLLRVNRDIRRLVIFGRSNIAKDAPISHVNLVCCRNMLIYFGSELQKHILNRLHYALEPGGILFLGKAESQLSNSSSFKRINARWRIFQKTPLEPMDEASNLVDEPSPQEGPTSEQFETLRAEQRNALDALRLGVIVIGPDGTITQSNAAALTMSGLASGSLIGQRVEHTELFTQNPELGQHVSAAKHDPQPSSFRSKVKLGEDEHLLEVTLRPVVDDRGDPSGSLISYEDITIQDKLQQTIGELETTSAELQSANEELETTNEELQSTNEELETTNEELQSTNEELETTNEELQSLNEELQTANQELEEQGREVEQINSFYEQALERIPLPVMLITRENLIEFWNTMALRLFGFKKRPPVELELEQLPVEKSARNQIIQRVRATLNKKKPTALRRFPLPDGTRPIVDVDFSLVEREGRSPTVLLVFRSASKDADERRTSNSREGNASRKMKMVRKKKK